MNKNLRSKCAQFLAWESFMFAYDEVEEQIMLLWLSVQRHNAYQQRANAPTNINVMPVNKWRIADLYANLAAYGAQCTVKNGIMFDPCQVNIGVVWFEREDANLSRGYKVQLNRHLLTDVTLILVGALVRCSYALCFRPCLRVPFSQQLISLILNITHEFTSLHK